MVMVMLMAMGSLVLGSVLVVLVLVLSVRLDGGIMARAVVMIVSVRDWARVRVVQGRGHCEGDGGGGVMGEV